MQGIMCQMLMQANVNESESVTLYCRRLDANAFICDCQMMWLTQLLKDKGQGQSAATCEAPANMQGKVLTSLTNQELDCSEHFYVFLTHIHLHKYSKP